MPLEKIVLRVKLLNSGKRLDDFLAKKLTQILSQPLSKGKIRKLIIAGAVYINQKRVRIASKLLWKGASVEIFIDQKKLFSEVPTSEQAPFVMTQERILFEDPFLIVVDKPSGLPTQPTLDEARENLFASIKKFLSERDQHIQPYLGIHHRLDRDTSGIILFTKAKEANAGMSEIFCKHLVTKIYHAIVHKPQFWDPSIRKWSIKNYLARISRSNQAAKYGSVRSGGQFAWTDFQWLEETPSALWIEARLHTGRTHQIRVHLAESQMPVLGDPYYGCKNITKYKNLAQRTLLHAAHLTFPHPIHKTEVSIQCSLPKDFTECLRELKQPMPLDF